MAVTIVKIIDENDFDKVLMIRVFTDYQMSRTWASHQLIAIRRSLADAGEDLLDIEAKFTDFEDQEVNDPAIINRPGHQWRLA